MPELVRDFFDGATGQLSDVDAADFRQPSRLAGGQGDAGRVNILSHDVPLSGDRKHRRTSAPGKWVLPVAKRDSGEELIRRSHPAAMTNRLERGSEVIHPARNPGSTCRRWRGTPNPTDEAWCGCRGPVRGRRSCCYQECDCCCCSWFKSSATGSMCLMAVGHAIHTYSSCLPHAAAVVPSSTRPPVRKKSPMADFPGMTAEISHKKSPWVDFPRSEPTRPRPEQPDPTGAMAPSRREKSPTVEFSQGPEPNQSQRSPLADFSEKRRGRDVRSGWSTDVPAGAVSARAAFRAGALPLRGSAAGRRTDSLREWRQSGSRAGRL